MPTIATVDLPTIALTGADWEIIIPRHILRATGLRNVTISDHGLYIEATTGAYDLLPWHELAILLEDSPADTVSPILTAPHPTNGRHSTNGHQPH